VPRPLHPAHQGLPDNQFVIDHQNSNLFGHIPPY
jgi:hypothetical protein